MRRPGLAGLLCAASVALALACAAIGRRPAWELPVPEVREGPVVPAERLHRAHLPNGLALLVLEDPRLPRIELGVAVRRGAGILDRNEAGLAVYAAELMERGAGSRDALALAQAVDRVGASLAVSAGWDAMTVSLSGLTDDRELLFEILADVVRRPRFDADEAERARAEQLAALERAKDDPGTLASWHFARTLYPEHSYGLPLEGTPETVTGLDAQAARRFYGRVFVASNAILFVVGDVDPVEVRGRVEAAFADWPAGQVPDPGAPPPESAPPERRIVVVDRPDLNQSQIRVGHEGIARRDPIRVPAGLMNGVLGGNGFLSRLLNRVRAEEGLTYTVGSGFSLRRHPGPFYVYTFTRVEETRRVVDLLLAELERMKSEPPTAEELSQSKSFAAGQFALGLETASAIAGGLVDLDVHGLPEDALDTYRSRVRAAKAEQVAEVARTLLHPERAAIVVVGPAEELREQLASLGSVEVVSP